MAGDTGPGIPVDLRLDDIYLELWTEGEELGVWRLDVVEVTRSAGNKFSLDLDGEAMVFEAIDPLGFAYEGLTFIEAVSSKLRKKRRGFRRRDGESQPLRGARVPGRSEPEPANPISEERVRSLPGVAALEQVEALPEPEPVRPAAAAAGGLGAFFASPADAPSNHVSPPTTQEPPSPADRSPVEPPSQRPVADQPIVRESPAWKESTQPSGPLPEPEVVVVEELASVSYAHDAVVEVTTAPEQPSQSHPGLRSQDSEPAAEPTPVEPEPVLEAQPVEPEPEAVLEAQVEVEPVESVVPEPVMEARPVESVLPEPVVEPEPVVVPEPEAVVEPEPVLEAQPVEAVMPEPEAVVEPEPVLEAQPVETVEPVVVEPEPVSAQAIRVEDAVEPAPALNGRAPSGELHEAVIADPHTGETSSEDTDGEADDDAAEPPATRGRHTTSRRGRRSKRKRTDDHDHEYDIARTVGGLTRRVCMHCGHVSFDSEDVYQGWG